MHYHMDLKVREGFPVPTPRQDFSYLPDAGCMAGGPSIFGAEIHCFVFGLVSLGFLVKRQFVFGGHFGPSKLLYRLLSPNQLSSS